VPKPKKKKKPTLAQMRKKLDRLWFEAIYKRDKGICQYCKRGDTLAAHHIFGKKAYPSGRWNLDNGVLLCYAHHIFYAHAKPEEFRRWVIPWMAKRSWHMSFYNMEEMYDWLFAHVQEVKQFRACHFEEEKNRLEKELNDSF